jgi:hypothetical protein
MPADYPAYRPTQLSLTLGDYPVLVNTWRSVSSPELLGSLPVGAVLQLSYENVLDEEALALMTLWTSTAGGLDHLNPLPSEVAAGILDDAETEEAEAANELANKYLLDIAPLVWVMNGQPRQESVKNGRSTVQVELVSELRLAPEFDPPVITYPEYQERTDVSCVGSTP